MFFRKTVYNEMEKTLMLFRLLILVNQLEKLSTMHKLKIKCIKDKFLNHTVYISTSELKNAKLRTKDDIANFVKKANFC